LEPVPIVRRGPAYNFLGASLEMGRPGRLACCADPPDGRYFLTIAVMDYPRLLARSGGTETLSALSERDLAHIRDGRATLVLDHANEGPAFHADHFDALHHQLDERRIPRNAAVYTCQNRRLANDYAAKYGPEGLKFWPLDYFPNVVITFVNTQRGKEVFGDPFDPGDYVPLRGGEDKVFNCLNAAVRWHRVLLYRWLQVTGLADHGLISFHGIGPANPKGNEINVDAPPPELMEAFGYLLKDLRLHLPAEPLRFDDSALMGNQLSRDILVSAYRRSLLSVVSESDFFTNTERLTEKSVKAAVMGHPFIVVGAPRTVNLLRELGFLAFDGLIDHSYDLIDEPMRRLEVAFRSIANACDFIRRDPDRWRELARETAAFNFEHARGALFDRFEKLTTEPYLLRMTNFIATGDLLD
jgi:hypothetical protein